MVLNRLRRIAKEASFYLNNKDASYNENFF